MNEHTWKSWYTREDPENEPLPADYGKGLSKFQHLLLVKSLRSDRVINATRNFIKDSMGEMYISSPTVDFEKVANFASEKTPIVVILSPGSDPGADIIKAATVCARKFETISLGQGVESIALKMVQRGAKEGHWVVVNNCHMLQRWLEELEAAL